MAEVGFTDTDTFETKLKKLAADHDMTLTAADSTIAARRLQDAYNIILAALMARGLTKAQVDTWSRGTEYQLDIATYWYGRDSGWSKRTSMEEEDWLKVFDRAGELKDCVVIDDSGTILLSSGNVVARVMDLEELNSAKGYYP